jgi:cytochrome c oxidase cbb3-type subunit 4
MALSLIIVRSMVTVALFVLFIALCIWAWSERRRDEFTAAARLPLDTADEATPDAATRDAAIRDAATPHEATPASTAPARPPTTERH